MLRNLSRTGYVFLALSQEQGIVLKPFLVRNRVRVLGSQRHTPTLKFWEYPPSQLDEFKRKDWGEEKFGGGCITLNSSTRRQKLNSLPSTPEIEFPPTHKTTSYANYGHGRISLII